MDVRDFCGKGKESEMTWSFQAWEQGGDGINSHVKTGQKCKGWSSLDGEVGE